MRGVSVKCMALFAALAACGPVAGAAVVQLGSPAEMSAPLTTLDFEGYPHLTAANTPYESRGVTFSRDDGALTAIYDPTGYETHSGARFLATPSWVGAPTHSLHLNVNFLSPAREVGAWFGNDRNEAGVFDSLRLSAFGPGGEPLGTVAVTSNRNGNADQFIGLRSDTPFTRARFEHDAEAFGVGIDDLAFTAVPEPGAALVLLAPGVLLPRRLSRVRVMRGLGGNSC